MKLNLRNIFYLIMGNQMSDALGLISVVVIVVLTMVLTVAWDRWQVKDNGQRKAV